MCVRVLLGSLYFGKSESRNDDVRCVQDGEPFLSYRCLNVKEIKQVLHIPNS